MWPATRPRGVSAARRPAQKAWSDDCLSALSEILTPLRDEEKDRIAAGGRLLAG